MKAPSYNDGSPAIDINPNSGIGYSGLRPNADSFGAPVAEATVRSGSQTLRTADILADRSLALQGLANETLAKEADIEYGKLRSGLWATYRNNYGKDAVEKYPKFAEELETNYRALRDKLPNDEARKMFDSSAVRQLTYMQETGATYAAQENKRWMVNAADARIDNKIDDGALFWNNGEEFKRVLGTVRDESEQKADLLGLDKDSREALIRDNTSKAWSARIRAVMAHDAGAARTMYEAAKPELEAKQSAMLESQITERQLLEERKAEINEARALRLEEDRIKKVSRAQEDKIIRSIFNDDPGVTVQSIANNDAMLPGTKIQMIGVLDQYSKPDAPAAVSRNTVRDLFDRMHLPDGDPRKIVDTTPINQEYSAGRLTKADFDWTRKEFADSRTSGGDKLGQRQQEFLKGIRPTIERYSPLLGNLDNEGAVKFYEFQWYVSRRIQQQREAGKDPYDLFDPSKPEYLGKPETLAPYQKPLDASLKSITDKLGAMGGAPSVPPSERPSLDSIFGPKK